jgi:hypothetical protein
MMITAVDHRATKNVLPFLLPFTIFFLLFTICLLVLPAHQVFESAIIGTGLPFVEHALDFLGGHLIIWHIVRYGWSFDLGWRQFRRYVPKEWFAHCVAPSLEIDVKR